MPIEIAVKLLACLNRPDGGCPRCFWLRCRQRSRMPFSIFPGIFSSLDSYAKKLVSAAHDGDGLPTWLTGATGFVEPIPVPHWSRFKRLDPATELVLVGAPDSMFRRLDRSFAISDFKTARHTAAQDALIDLYRAQLNGYAWIADSLGYAPLSHLSLIYTEPVTEFVAADVARLLDATGFILPFSTVVIPVAIETNTLIPALLRRARRIIDGAVPDPAATCTDCERLQQLSDLLTEGATCRR